MKKKNPTLGRFRARARKFERQTPQVAPLYLSFLALITGIISGYGAILFRYMISFFHNLFFFGKISLEYDSTQHFVSDWGVWVIAIPVLGMLLSHWLTSTFAPEAKGHGVPEVMYAVAEKRGRIRPIVSFIKSLASAICIGAGGSVGREGPIVQIGSSFGSSLGQLLGLRPRHVILLVGCGVAGGIAATFNAPIGGVAFAIELILPEYNLLTFMPLIISATTATYIASSHLGTAPAFVLPEYGLVSSFEFLLYLLLGIAVAGAAILFISTLYRTEDFFDRFHLNPHLKALFGSLLLGITGYLLFHFSGNYQIFGVGYAFISDTLTENHLSLILLLLLVLFKIFATSITLGAGGSGGVFAPSLFIGAGLGSAVGVIFNHFFPTLSAPPSAYALVGMAAMVAGTTGATLTSIVMTFEMTRNYSIMLPLMLSVVAANYLVRTLYKETIYTKKLTRRGINIQFDKLISIFRITPIRAVLHPKVISVAPTDTVSYVIARDAENQLNTLPVIEENKVLGTIHCNTIFTALPNEPIRSYILQKDIALPIEKDCMDALEKMDTANSDLLIIQENQRVAGVLTRSAIIREYFRKKRTIM